MDSVSQMVLGAAVGEAVLGRKLGNRAMFWGAVGGTIPDLDVITSPFLSELQSLAFHRGISHSIFFAVLGGLASGWLLYRLHKSPYYRQILMAILSLFISCIPTSLFFFLFADDHQRYYYAALALGLAVPIFMGLKRWYAERPKFISEASLRSWQWMFFWAYLTHALLDTFTMYGTQLFMPFSDYRAAIASISVADPFGYTLPFVICLVIASRYNRTTSKRRFWTYAGIAISTGYLLLTIWHKQKINRVYRAQLTEQGISYTRMISGPAIMNNFLWNATVEAEDAYYMGQYSIFDTSPISFLKVPKNHDLISAPSEDNTVNVLSWFSDGFYSVYHRADGLFQINDLRFGTFRGTGEKNDFIFRFVLDRDANGNYELLRTEGGPSEEDDRGEIFKDLWLRIKGI